MRSKITFIAATKLFDFLIKQIFLYGAPLFTPTSPVVKAIVKSIKTNKPLDQNFLPKVSHLQRTSFMKWALGVHHKASNIGTWGETGRYPLVYQAIRLTLHFYKMLQNLPNTSFAKAGLKRPKAI